MWTLRSPLKGRWQDSARKRKMTFVISLSCLKPLAEQAILYLITISVTGFGFIRLENEEQP